MKPSNGMIDLSDPSVRLLVATCQVIHLKWDGREVVQGKEGSKVNVLFAFSVV